MRLYRTGEAGFQVRLSEITGRTEAFKKDVEPVVREILEAVRQRGDQALVEYTQRFDGAILTSQELKAEAAEVEAAYQEVTEENLNVLKLAAQRIRTFHESQKQTSWIADVGEGSWAGQLVRPLSRVGAYVPGEKRSILHRF